MTLSEVLTQQIRALLFKKVQLAPSSDRWVLYVYLLLVALLVGAGRYWDHPSAYSWQYLGLGSVTYIFILSALLYLVVLPLQPARWTYSTVFVFVGFTSLPALLYAIPVERLMHVEQAKAVNAWFLAVVAVWRVALYVNFLKRGAGLEGLGIFVATLLPLSAIIASLAFLNLEHVVFNIMAGIGEGVRSQNDTAYAVVFWLSVLSYILMPLTLILYVVEVRRVQKIRKVDGD